MKQGTQAKKITVFLSLLMILVLALQMPVQAATVTTKTVASKVKTAVKSSNYPFTSDDSVTSRRKVFGVDVSLFDEYTAYQKTTGSGSNQAEYILFIGKATSKANAKKAKKALKSFISEESDSMANYLSKQGKKNFKKAQVSYSGKWVWGVVLDSSVTSKAVKAIKKAIK